MIYREMGGSRSGAIFGRSAITRSLANSHSNGGDTRLGLFRTTDADKAPPRSIVTARLLGDPAPDRVVPDIPRTAAELRIHHSQPTLRSPINLTFAQSRATFGTPDQ